MEKPLKLQESELKKLQDFQYQSESLIYQLGQLASSKLRIETEETNLKFQYQQLIKLEKEIGDEFKEKYNNAQIDIKTGDIIYSS